MTINTTTKIINPFTNETVKDGEKDLTLGLGLATCAGINGTSNPALSYRLSLQLLSKEEVELMAEDIVFLKECVNKIGNNGNNLYPPFVSGQMIELLEK